MRKLIIAVLGVLLIGVAGCSVSTSADSPDAGISADDTVEVGGVSFGDLDLDDLEDDGVSDDDVADTSDDDTTVDDDDDDTTVDDDDDDVVDEGDDCSYSMHSVSASGFSGKKGDYVDITFTVTGGSGNFKWYHPSDSELPIGLSWDEGDTVSHIKGTVGESSLNESYTIKVKDQSCGNRSDEIDVTIETIMEIVIIDDDDDLDLVYEDENVDAVVTFPYEFEPKNVEKIVEKIKVTLYTGDMKGAGTDCKIWIKFCSDKAFTDCWAEKKLAKKDYNDNERNAADSYEITGLNLKPKRVKYFKVWWVKNGDNKPWQFEGIKVEHILESGKRELAYYNPCINKWLYSSSNAHFKFGPKDVAVCSIIETGTPNKAGTNDKVWVVFPDHVMGEVVRGAYDDSTSRAPYFETEPEEGSLALRMNWGKKKKDFNDFQNNMTTSYGDYSFDNNVFFSNGGFMNHDVTIRKERDRKGKNSGWFLDRFKVYIFKPAEVVKYDSDGNLAISESSGIYYVNKKVDDWIQDESQLFATGQVSMYTSWNNNFDSNDFVNMGYFR